MSISAGSTSWCRASTPTVATSSARRSANQLDQHAEAVDRSVGRQGLDLGLRRYSRADLEAMRAGR
ncbi:MAG: hypothetical protein R3C69_18280 [Geminicoccaceae bacterium]